MELWIPGTMGEGGNDDEDSGCWMLPDHEESLKRLRKGSQESQFYCIPKHWKGLLFLLLGVLGLALHSRQNRELEEVGDVECIVGCGLGGESLTYMESMATRAWMCSVPVTRGPRDVSILEHHHQSASSSGERVGSWGSVRISRRWAALVLPIASSIAALQPLPATAEDIREGGKVVLRTHKGCGLGVSRYPDFVYNAEGGGGSGNALQMPDGRWHVQFDASEVTIPAVGFNTTTLLGVPLPPPIRIDIVPDMLQGIVDRESGKVELTFQAKFYFSAGPLYRPPPLIVDTLLTTESTQGEIRGGTGSRLDNQGNCRLVGVARLAPIDDLFLSTFLALPSECLADMSANFSFTA